MRSSNRQSSSRILNGTILHHTYRWWSVTILALTGPGLLWLDVPTLLQPLLLPLLAGVWLAADGAYTLARYLRANPYPRAPEGVRA